MRAKDYITCAIFSVLNMVGMLIAAVTNVSGYTTILYSVVSSFFTGLLFYILVLKVQKRGTIFVFAIVPGLYFLTTGLLEGMVGIVCLLISSFVAEIILKNNYTNPKKISLAACIYTLYGSTIGLVENFVFTETYCQRALDQGINPKVVEDMRKVFNIKPLWAVVIAAVFLSTFLGTLVGKKIINKHLKKIGIV